MSDAVTKQLSVASTTCTNADLSTLTQPPVTKKRKVQNLQTCNHFARDGKCPFGIKCKFEHILGADIYEPSKNLKNRNNKNTTMNTNNNDNRNRWWSTKEDLFNNNFNKYYRIQKILGNKSDDESEWKLLYKTLRTQLPTSFRFNPSSPLHQIYKQRLKQDFYQLQKYYLYYLHLF